MMPFHWLPEHVAAIPPDAAAAPAIGRGQLADVLPGWDVWDHWPVQTRDGSSATVAGGALIFALAAPRGDDPDERHGLARLWLFHATGAGWRPLGPAFGDQQMPGSRHWSGSAVREPNGEVRLFFTAVGEHGEAAPGMMQQLFETRAALRTEGGVPALGRWQPAAECVRPDGVQYQRELAGGGAIGTIKAFRDPYLLSVAGSDWLLFAGSDATTRSPWNGAIGAARWTGSGWSLAPPLVTAAGLNNELERPHAIVHQGAPYLFWSTQAHVFADGGPRGPTGLYGVTADRWGAPWRPLNGTGLVFANPATAPLQAYSFQVLADLSVWSFADMPGMPAMPAGPAARRAAFAGGPAPMLHLLLDGAIALLVPS